MPEAKLHWNKPQIIAELVNARTAVFVWGRRTGKTTGPVTNRIRRCLTKMPQSVGAVVADTFQRLLTKELPQIISSLSRQGYYRDVHYVIGHAPPKKWDWPKSFLMPLKYDYYFWFKNGAGFNLISQDREGTSNGLDIDWISGVEAKFLDREKLMEELIPTLSGNPMTRVRYHELPEFRSTTFSTDMPTTKKSAWIFDYENEEDAEGVNLILSIMKEIHECNDPNTIRRLHALADNVRCNTVHFSTASTLENIEVVGEDYIREQRRKLTRFVFETAILNLRKKKAELGFYPDLNEEWHLYSSFNYSFLDKAGYDFESLKELDCRQDNDLQHNEPIEIAMDYGGTFNCLLAAQIVGNELKVLKNFYVKHPGKPKDVVAEFCKYYRFHGDQTVIYHYDHTAVSSIYPFRDEVVDAFSSAGWNCDPHYIGQAPNHEEKYNLISDVLREQLDQYPRIRINRHNCEELVKSLEGAPQKQGYKQIEKDKSSEKKSDEEYPQEEATHLSDAFDTLIWSTCAPITSGQDFYETKILGK